MTSPPSPARAASPRASVEELLRHATWLRALARHLVDDAAAADDLVQETWLAALERPPSLERPVRPWLSVVARRLAAFARRGEVRREQRERREAATRTSSASAPSTDVLVARAELQRKLVEAVLALDEPARSTILLCYFEGVAPSELAKLHDEPAATVRSRLKRGLDELRARFDAESNRGGGIDWRSALAPLVVDGAGLHASGSAVAAGTASAGMTVAMKLAAVLVVGVTIGAAFLVVKSWRERVESSPLQVADASKDGSSATRGAALASNDGHGAMKDSVPLVAQRVESTTGTPSLAPAEDSAHAPNPTSQNVEPNPKNNPIRPGVMRLRALCPDGTPYANARIHWKLKREAPGPDGLADELRGSSDTDGDGLFTTGVPAIGRYNSITLCATGLLEHRKFAVVVHQQPQIDVIDLRFVPAPRLLVTVRDRAGEPIESFLCTVPTTYGWFLRGDESDEVIVPGLLRPQILLSARAMANAISVQEKAEELRASGHATSESMAEMLSEMRRGSLGKPSSHAGGHVELDSPLPPERFLVVVEAPGFARGWAGPFVTEFNGKPEDRKVELILDRTSAVAGHVLAGGKPVQGARVSLWTLSGPEQHWVRNGFPVRVDPFTEESSESDADGKFAFARPEAPNGLLIRAEAGEFAPTEVMLSTAALANPTDLVLEMRPGGSIVGRVVVAPAESANGVRLAASRGDIAPRFVEVGEDGMFRFDHVMPGRWLIEQRDPEGTSFLAGGVTIQSVSDAPQELPWNCEVTEGGVTELTLDFTPGRTAILEGTIVVDGNAVPGSVQLISQDGGELPSDDFDAKGHFRLETARIGELTIRVAFQKSTERNLESLELVASRELHRGSQELNIALATASLELENLPRDEESLTYAVKLEGGVEAHVAVAPDEHASCKLPVVPAGHGRLIRDAGSLPWEFASGPVLLELDLKPGEKAHARVP